MPFSSLLFLSAFLPVFLAVYALSPRVLKNGVALVFSCLFYAWGAPRLLPVVLALGVLDYYLGHAVVRARERGDDRRAKCIVAFAITIHLSVLAYFKYSNFLVGQTNDLLSLLPASARIAWTEVPLPIGISFLTFEEISYLVDVYRGDARPARSVGRYLLFLMLFPHSIAGPIFRWKDLEAQLGAREHSLTLVSEGFSQFVFGLAKKVLVADAAAVAVDRVFATNELVDPRMAWVAAVAYALQIYFDFSGYSDMAIGLGKMIGFRFKPNFDSPYRSASITEFWKRWHISLSTWLRDYLYVPLGGNRGGERRTRLNVLIVFTLSGFWHGAAWTFVIWGFFHGALVVAERTAAIKRLKAALPRPVNVALTFLLVTIGWVFFRAQSLSTATRLLRTMFTFSMPARFTDIYWGQILPFRSIVVLVVAFIGTVGIGALVGEQAQRSAFDRLRLLGIALVPVALVLVIAQLVNSGFTPLIYFKF
jgi:alginate O-acetyltransferase complex protein AlgI